MTTEVKRLIRVREDKGARFKRDGYGKKRQLSDSWRKPRGQHSKKREQKKAKGALPKPGFGSPVAVRGMHPSGYFEVLISSLKELEGLDPKVQAVRIGATVGMRKRTLIQDKALTEGFRVLNARVVKTARAKPAKVKPVKKDEGEEKAEKTEEKVRKKAPEKVKAPAGKAPARKTAVKPKAEKTEEKAEKTEEKVVKKVPAKKAAAKPKAEKTEEKAEKKAPSKKAAAKTKTTKSGVKKDE